MIRARTPRGTTFCAFVVLACTVPAAAAAHPALPPPVPSTPPRSVDPIPEEDQDLYQSRVAAVKPRVPGLSAEILGGDEKLQVTWKGEPPLVILGTEGEPMLRLSSAGVELNERSPSVFLAADRYAQVPLPTSVDPSSPPRWRRIDSPGSISWYEHRAQWMDADRPPVVGDGTEPRPIFHWRVPALLGDQSVTIAGTLDWIPDASAIRSERSDVSSPLLSAAILIAAMALGAGVGVLVRRRREAGRLGLTPPQAD